MKQRQSRLAHMFSGAVVILSFLAFVPTYSGDLMASWLAGHFLEIGRPDQVYPALTPQFQMLPPSQWRAFMLETYHYKGPIFPFLYPPIWAKLAQLFTHLDFWKLSVLALAGNCILLGATLHLAWRASRPRTGQLAYIFLAALFLYGSTIGQTALLENQPQILVSFLVVLTIERQRANAPVLAGTALALAAAIKIYPALFAFLFLAGRQWKALASFLIAGAALAGASILWAGWPLHALFLEQVRLISRSVLVTGLTINLDSLYAQLFQHDNLIRITSDAILGPDKPSPHWDTMARPVMWRLISMAALVGTTGLLMAAYARASAGMRARIIWPLASIAMALLLPISWAYYFIPAACFAPNLLDRLPGWPGKIILSVSFALHSWPAFVFLIGLEKTHGITVHLYQISFIISMIILAGGFVLAMRNKSADDAQSRFLFR